jgi:hypothetical protein
LLQVSERKGKDGDIEYKNIEKKREQVFFLVPEKTVMRHFCSSQQTGIEAF